MKRSFVVGLIGIYAVAVLLSGCGGSADPVAWREVFQSSVQGEAGDRTLGDVTLSGRPARLRWHVAGTDPAQAFLGVIVYDAAGRIAFNADSRAFGATATVALPLPAGTYRIDAIAAGTFVISVDEAG